MTEGRRLDASPQLAGELPGEESPSFSSEAAPSLSSESLPSFLSSESSELPPTESSPPCTLLSEDQILDYIRSQVDPGELSRISKHVRRCRTCQFLMDAALRAEHPRWGGVEPKGAWNANFPPGILLADRYLVLGFVGKGAMGEVYEALDNNLKQRRLALKTVVATASDSPRAEGRLRDEVLIAQLISHPNVCRIHNLEVHREEHELPMLFLTMEFIEGESLGRRLRKQGPLPIDMATNLARQLLHGLHAAHAASILHRDFKSDNVMLRTSHDTLQAVITDFGLARALDADMNLLASDSRHLVGTIPYMAPEQLRGEKLGPQADLFSFGVVLYEMLTGRLPFKGGIRQRPVVPSKALPGLSPRLDAFVLECLSLEPAERFPSAEDALAALDQLGRRPSLSRFVVPAAAACLLGAAIWGLAAGSRQSAEHQRRESLHAELPVPAAATVAPAAPAAPPAPIPSPESTPAGSTVPPVAAAPPAVAPPTALTPQPSAPRAAQPSGNAAQRTAARRTSAEPQRAVPPAASDAPGMANGGGAAGSEAPPLPPRERLLDPFDTGPKAQRDAETRTP